MFTTTKTIKHMDYLDESKSVGYIYDNFTFVKFSIYSKLKLSPGVPFFTLYLYVMLI